MGAPPILRMLDGIVEYDETRGLLLVEHWCERNRRVSSSLSPIFYLFLTSTGKLYLKVQRLLTEDEILQSNNPPLIKHRRPGPKHTTYGIPATKWPNVVQRVVEQKESLRTVAAAYGVSRETIRRILLHVHKQRRQQES